MLSPAKVLTIISLTILTAPTLDTPGISSELRRMAGKRDRQCSWTRRVVWKESTTQDFFGFRILRQQPEDPSERSRPYRGQLFFLVFVVFRACISIFSHPGPELSYTCRFFRFLKSATEFKVRDGSQTLFELKGGAEELQKPFYLGDDGAGESNSTRTLLLTLFVPREKIQLSVSCHFVLSNGCRNTVNPRLSHD